MKNRLMQFFFGGPGSATALGDVGLLIMRVTLGVYMAIAHGWGKIYSNGGLGPPQGLIDGVEQMGFPAPMLFAWLAALAEFLGALLVAAGLLARPAALALAINMSVAAFIAHGKDPWYGAPPNKEMAILYLAPFLALVFTGAGRFSIDRFLRKGRRRDARRTEARS